MDIEQLCSLMRPFLVQWYQDAQQDFTRDKPLTFADALLDMLFDRRVVGRAGRAAEREDLEDMPSCSADADPLSQGAHALRKIVRQEVREAMAPTYQTDPEIRADAFARVVAGALDRGVLVQAFETVRQADDVEKSELEAVLEEGRRRDMRDRERQKVQFRPLYPI